MPHHDANPESIPLPSPSESGKAVEGGVATVGQTPLSTFIASAVSAEDLRCLDMDKERQNVSSPRGVIEGCVTSLDTETDSSNANSEHGPCCSNSRPPSRWNNFLNLWKIRPIKRLATFPIVSKMSKIMSKSVRENLPSEMKHLDFDGSCDASWKSFSQCDLQFATNNFSDENLIGKGGYANVYKGQLEDGRLVAVKRLTQGTQEEKAAGFLSELGIIAHIKHPNTAKLVGYGVEGGLHLVVQLSQRGSLASVLHESEENLNWVIRYKIILGIADGLKYLHENCQRRIIHRDIKADNILLTENYEPQICDFGLSKWLPRQWTHCNVSKFEGTFGYFAPEYLMHGIVDEKTDVFAFGVLILEIITGRRALDDQQQSLVVWVKPLLDENNLRKLVDPALGDTYNLEELERVSLTASLCIEHSPILRPQMSQVAVLLRDDTNDRKCSKNCKNRVLRRIYSEELLDAEEYNSTRYLNDLTRHRQVALGT